jgi:SAM-dependent methyltransferase
VNITCPAPRCADAERQARARELRAAFDRSPRGAEADIRAELARYRFYHRIPVTPRLSTKGLEGTDVYVERFARALPLVDFAGKSVLDVGCRDGAMLFLAEEAGAGVLLGVDNDPSPGLVNFLAPFRGSRAVLGEASVYDLDPGAVGTFDIVVAAGLLYHLRYPCWALRTLARLVAPGGTLLLETGVLDAFDDFPVLFYPTGDASPYEPTSPSFFNLAGLANMLAMAGLGPPEILDRFAPVEFRLERHFPRFAEMIADPGPLTITRTLLRARPRMESPGLLDQYFEGLHSFHSAGAPVAGYAVG